MNICMKCGWWYGKRGQLKIFRSNWRRNPGLLGDYSGIHDANHVQVWCRRHLQSKNWIIWIKLDQVDPTYQEYAQNFFNLLLLFFLLFSGGPKKQEYVQNFANLLFFCSQFTWLLKLGSRIDWQLEAVSSNPMILKHSLENSTVGNHDSEVQTRCQ